VGGRDLGAFEPGDADEGTPHPAVRQAENKSREGEKKDQIHAVLYQADRKLNAAVWLTARHGLCKAEAQKTGKREKKKMSHLGLFGYFLGHRSRLSR
jgi:hypothetical protein